MALRARSCAIKQPNPRRGKENGRSALATSRPTSRQTMGKILLVQQGSRINVACLRAKARLCAFSL
jgi:hypothetical protein